MTFHAHPPSGSRVLETGPNELQVSSGTQGRSQGNGSMGAMSPPSPAAPPHTLHKSDRFTNHHVACWSPLQSGGAGRKSFSEHRGGEGDTHLEIPISCDSQPVTGATEMLRHGCDKADLASEARNFKGLGKEGKKSSGGDMGGDEPVSVSPHSLTSEPSPHGPLQRSPSKGSTQDPQTTEDCGTWMG